MLHFHTDFCLQDDIRCMTQLLLYHLHSQLLLLTCSLHLCVVSEQRKTVSGFYVHAASTGARQKQHTFLVMQMAADKGELLRERASLQSRLVAEKQHAAVLQVSLQCSSAAFALSNSCHDKSENCKWCSLIVPLRLITVILHSNSSQHCTCALMYIAPSQQSAATQDFDGHQVFVATHA